VGSWLRGGTPDESRIEPWHAQSNDREDIDGWRDHLVWDFVDEAIVALVGDAQYQPPTLEFTLSA